MKKGAGKVVSESEEEQKSLGKVVGWEREDEEGGQEKPGEEEEQEQEQEQKQEQEQEQEKWKNPYLIFLDNLDDSDGEEEVSDDPSFLINFLT